MSPMLKVIILPRKGDNNESNDGKRYLSPYFYQKAGDKNEYNYRKRCLRPQFYKKTETRISLMTRNNA